MVKYLLLTESTNKIIKIRKIRKTKAFEIEKIEMNN